MVVASLDLVLKEWRETVAKVDLAWLVAQAMVEPSYHLDRVLMAWVELQKQQWMGIQAVEVAARCVWIRQQG